MQPLAPGFSLTDNLLLTEELPAPPGATYRVWFALNVQMGQIVVIKVHPDGRIDPMDNDSSVRNPPIVTAPSIPVMPFAPTWNPPRSEQLAYVPPVSNPSTQPIPGRRVKPNGKSGLRYALIGLLLIGLSGGGFWFWSQQSKTGPPAANAAVPLATAPGLVSTKPGGLKKWEPPTRLNETTTKPTGAPSPVATQSPPTIASIVSAPTTNTITGSAPPDLGLTLPDAVPAPAASQRVVPPPIRSIAPTHRPTVRSSRKKAESKQSVFMSDTDLKRN